MLPETIVLADMEAGLEHLSWAGGTLRHADLLLVVANPQVKSLLTASRTIALGRLLGIPEIGLVGNRAGDDDRHHLEAFAGDHGASLLGVIPEDEAIIRADRAGHCLLDIQPSASAVEAIEALAAVISRADARSRPRCTPFE